MADSPHNVTETTFNTDGTVKSAPPADGQGCKCDTCKAAAAKKAK